MRLREDMLFAHPVLSPERDDYTHGLFRTDLDATINKAGDELVLNMELEVECDDLAELIHDGAASSGFFLVCRRTYFNRRCEMAPGCDRFAFRLSDFYGAVDVRPVIWSNAAKDDWQSAMLHPEYGGRVDLPANAILALGPGYRFSVDAIRLRPFESIFVLAEDPEVEQGEVRVDPGVPKITIRVASGTKARLENLRNLPQGRAILLNAIYLPAVMEVLSELRMNEGMYEAYDCHRIFKAKCDSEGVEPQTTGPLEGAQRLLSGPLNQLFRFEEELFQ